uniref:Uncharacterized protein n=1 Tax=Oncorhynchus kisutch TaxID=8019 RepID=A0A8C7M5Y1_ONCKI
SISCQSSLSITVPVHSQSYLSLHIIFCGFPELQNPGLSLDHFQLACVENRTMDNSNRADLDMHLEPIQPSVSVSHHGRFERLQKDPNCISHFTGAPPIGQWRSSCSLVRYMLAGVGLFILGFLIGHYTHRPAHPRIPRHTDHLQELLRDITAKKIQSFYNCIMLYIEIIYFISSLIYTWTYLGLKDIQQASYSILLSLTGPSHSSIVHWDSHQCFLPSGAQLDARNHNNNPTADQHFSYAACYAKGSLGAVVLYVQYGHLEDLRRARTTMNVINQVALLKLGQAAFFFKVSLLADMGFGGVLLYMDPCDSPSDQSLWHKAFGVNLNPRGDSSTPGYHATAFVSLHSPVRGTDTLRSTASFSLLQLTSDIQTDSDVSCCSVSPPCTCNSPFLPGVCVDVLKRSPRGPPDCWQLLPPSESSAFLQYETMCPANDPKDRDPSHVQMLNTCSWTWRRASWSPSSLQGSTGRCSRLYRMCWARIKVWTALEICAQYFSFQSIMVTMGAIYV